MRARRADGEIFGLDRANLGHLWGKVPDVQELLLTNISRGKRKLYAGKDIAVWRNVAERMARAARVTFKIVRRRRFGRGTELFLVVDQRRIVENLRQFFSWNAQREDRSVAVHHRRAVHTRSHDHAEFCG